MKTSNSNQKQNQYNSGETQSNAEFFKNSGLQLLQRNNENPRALPAPLKSVKQRPNNLLLSALSGEVFDKLRPFLEKISLAADQYLYQLGDLTDYLYFPETAVISYFRVLEDGRMIETAMVGREGVIGFASLMRAKRSSGWSQTSVAGSAFRISLDVFREEFRYNNNLQSLLFDYIGCYVNQIAQRAICNNFHDTRQRFCGWLLMISKRGHNAALHFTQERIASNLGIHRPTLSYIAKNLQQRKVIDYSRGRISILNASELEAVACDCYRQIDSRWI